jgi:hypothetical protein
MARYVIDTNVAIVANGDEDVAIECRLAAVETLTKAVNKGVIVVDAAGEIQDEYRRHLNPHGQPGVGDRFYLEVINCHPDRTLRVDIPKRQDGEFKDLPQPIIDAGFDPSDRKFAAAAKKSNSPVYNATDSDWGEHRALIEAAGIKVVFLCGCKPENWEA